MLFFTKPLRWLTACLLLIITISAAYATTTRPVGAAITCYVSTTGGSNAATATSWATSTSNLQGAIDYVKKNGGGQVWVANGLYKPGTTTASSFSLANNVAIYGGFTIGQTSISDRNLTGPSGTTLTGDLGGGINSVHVINNPESLSLTASAVLDGFVITGGKATGSGNSFYGGGIYNGKASPAIRNCLFAGNAAGSGGAMYNTGNSPVISNCSFASNTAIVDGGAIYNNDNNTVTIQNCSFHNNSAINGGVIYNNNNSAAIIQTCSFHNNSAANGGAIYSVSSPALSISACSFQHNSAPNGGALCNTGGSPTIIGCSFQHNSSSHGGAIQNNNTNASPTVINCLFSDNSASEDGGAINNDFECSPKLINCVFQKNNASNRGGAVYNMMVSHPEFINCSFSGNIAMNQGDVIFNSGSSATLENSIVFGHSGTVAFRTTNDIDGNGGQINARFCLLETSSVSSEQFFQTDCLTTTTSPFASTASVALSVSSSAINAGNPQSQTVANPPYSATNLPVTDQAGNPRIRDGRVDMGALEYTPCATPQFVQQPASGSAICPGGSLSLTVSATSSTGTVAYQWLKNGQPLSTPQNTSVLSLSSLTANDAGSYAAVATNGCISVTSSAFSLTVNTLAGFTQQPATASAVCTDATVSIAVSATGTPAAGQQSLNYQWFRNGNLLQGQNNAALTLTDVTAPQAGSYSVVVTGACNSITSTAFSLSVTDLASLSISSITLCPTQTGSLMASGCNGGTISWSTGSPDITAGNELSIVSATCLAGSCSAVAQGNVVVTNQTPPPATLSSLIADESGCPVKLIAQGTAGSFVFTGPNGYVFSTVYRQSAARQATATQVKVPGIYTLRAVNTTVCGSSTPVNLTVTVSRSCP
nr:immunoglobulin domain-containing protein [uncultured Arsenicibacter sp.]